MLRFEVRSIPPIVRVTADNGDVLIRGDKFIVETRRYERKDAEEDVELLKLFGKSAWIVEIE